MPVLWLSELLGSACCLTQVLKSGPDVRQNALSPRGAVLVPRSSVGALALERAVNNHSAIPQCLRWPQCLGRPAFVYMLSIVF